MCKHTDELKRMGLFEGNPEQEFICSESDALYERLQEDIQQFISNMKANKVSKDIIIDVLIACVSKVLVRKGG